jgi:hypothetical protein
MSDTEKEKANAQLEQATAAMIAAARKVALSNGPLMNTPVGRLTDQQWGVLCTASLFAWIRCRNEQAIGESYDAEQKICDTGLQPSPINVAIVTSILPKLAETAGIDWSLPLLAWSKDEMINFLMLVWKLIDKAEIAAAHNRSGVLQKAGDWDKGAMIFPISLWTSELRPDAAAEAGRRCDQSVALGAQRLVAPVRNALREHP